MCALFAHIEPADYPLFVWLRISASAEPARKPAMLVAHTDLNDVLMLLDAANSPCAEALIV
ncbi:cupin domain-containing protein [Paraburkholderia ferrariae]|uniref:hypothetical protein n=1 Tax=Paraburkholderia ferrariae TaxID=386056 RepID=UPI0005A88AB2|nr:hypothetical protein [Paraburkholderia ferrariae]